MGVTRTAAQTSVGMVLAGLFAIGCSFGDPDDSSAEDDSTESSSSSSSNTSTSAGGSSSSSATNSGATSSGTGGSGGSGGTGGTGGTGGSGGGGLECGDVTGTPGVDCSSVDPTSFGTCCERCTLSNCCEAYAQCYAVEPYHVCAGDEDSNDSEVNCIIDCMVVEEDLELCAGQCAGEISGPICGSGTISGATNELVSCINGDENMLGGCFEECFTDFDEDTCLY